MSGRTRWQRADGEWVTGYRKTGRRNPRRSRQDLMNAAPPKAAPGETPDYRLMFELPETIAFSVASGPTSVIGVSVGPRDIVEVIGKNRDWVLGQAAEYLGIVAGGQPHSIPGKLTRAAYPGPNPSAPWHPDVKLSVEIIYVPKPAVIVPRYLDRAMIFPVKR